MKPVLGPLEILFFLVLLVAASRAQEVPDLRETSPQGELRGHAADPWESRAADPAAPLTHHDAHKRIVPPPRPTPTPTPPPEQAAVARIGERVRLLSTLQAAPWVGGRWRGKGTGASDGGAAISATLPSGLKPTVLIGPRSLGAALGYSRIFAGGIVASGKVYAVLGFEPLVW